MSNVVLEQSCQLSCDDEISKSVCEVFKPEVKECETKNEIKTTFFSLKTISLTDYLTIDVHCGALQGPGDRYPQNFG